MEIEQRYCMHSLPLCIIGLTVYNDASHIAEAMHSIFAQSYKHFIFCIVNDGSTDNTATIIDSFADPRLHVIHLPQNKGRPYARNMALDFALRLHIEQKAQYFFWMDGDDIAVPDRVEKQVAHMEKHPHIDILGTAVTYFDEAKGKMKKPSSHEAILAQSIWGASLFNPTSCFRLQRLAQSGLRYDAQLLRAEDYGFWLDALFTTSLRLANMPEALLYYRYQHRPTNNAYHALAAERLLRYLGLPHHAHNCQKHTALSCSDFMHVNYAEQIIQEKSSEEEAKEIYEKISEKGAEVTQEKTQKHLQPTEILSWANEVYEAVLAHKTIHQGHFLRITHYKMEQFFAWSGFDAMQKKALLKAYAFLPLGKTHDLRPLFRQRADT